MSRIPALLALAAGFLSSIALAQANPPAAKPTPPSAEPAAPTTCLPSTTLDELTKALDDAISGPADKDRTCMRQLLYPDARLIPVGRTLEGTFAPHVNTVTNWIDAMRKRGNLPFYERQVKVQSETFGHIAHLWSTYELRSGPEGPAVLRGINSIQAVFDGSRWKITEILWQAETPTERVPEKNLP